MLENMQFAEHLKFSDEAENQDRVILPNEIRNGSITWEENCIIADARKHAPCHCCVRNIAPHILDFDIQITIFSLGLPISQKRISVHPLQ
jgi:hypothetical protein